MKGHAVRIVHPRLTRPSGEPRPSCQAQPFCCRARDGPQSDDRSLNCWLIVIKEIPGMRNLADCTADMGSFLSAAASFYNVMDRVAVLLDI